MGLIAVQVDSREPAQIQKLTFGGVPKVVVELDAGDVVAACDDGALLAIERKTPSDLFNTLKDDRLFPQLARLRALTPFAYLVVCGGLYPGANDTAWFDDGSALGQRESGWQWSSVQGALVHCQEMGVHVVFANGLLDFEPTVLRLAKRDRSAVRVAPARDVTLLSEYEQVLIGLPGIGPERAQMLIQHCGTPADALQFLADVHHIDRRVPGFGPGLKRLVRGALGLADDMELAIVPRGAGVSTPPVEAPTPELAGVAA
jgi:ERCC4-type nuclease